MSSIDQDDIPENWPPERGKGRGRHLRGGGGRPPVAVGIAGFLLIAILFLTLALMISGRMGVANVAANEVAVKVNYITGSTEVIATPGIKLYLPLAQEIFILDKKAQQFTMEGNRYSSNDHVARLTVRANDGSNFWFDSLTVHYELVPGETAKVLEDSGPRDAYKEEWIRAHARSILRDEFGRYSAIEVADPTVYNAAPIAARDRMNELLGPHGIRVTKIPVPDPKFDPDYERAIEMRKEADQEIQRLIAEELTIAEESGRRLAAVDKEKSVERAELQGDLQKALLASEERAINVKRGADAFAVERIANGEGAKAEMIENARGNEAKYRKEAQGIEKNALALAERGEVIVREAIIQKLMNIQFTLIPYSRDPAPQRLEHKAEGLFLGGGN